jgi:HEAT repeat protein
MDNVSSFPLIDEQDHAILMHKEVHFGGDFSLMIEYYKEDGKGVIEEFALERICELAEIEMQNNLSLSSEILAEEEQQEVIRAKEKYETLKKVYDLPPCLAHKIADLIFAEDFDAEKEIEALVASPESIPLLIRIIKDDDFYNPLFPGYGFAPLHAIECLGFLKAKEAIIPLFESLSKTEFFGEEAVIHALFQIGEPAKEFLLNVLKNTPLTKDNENAAIALLLFKDDPAIPSACLKLLTLPEVQARPILFTYLLLFCDELKDLEEQKQLKELASLPHLTKESREELEWILKAY